MPRISIDVPAGSRIKVKSGPGVMRTVAYEVAMASQEAKADRSAKRFARIVWPDNFSVGDLVENINTFQSCGRHSHAIVTHVGEPSWNQQIHLSYDEVVPTRTGWGVQADKYRQSRYSSRRGCECRNCKGWNKLPLLQRWKRRREAIRDDT